MREKKSEKDFDKIEQLLKKEKKTIVIKPNYSKKK